MFIRRDKVTIKRMVYKKIFGEVEYIEPLVVAENVPCHLSVLLENTAFRDNVPYLFSSFLLFLDFNPEIQIKENDILFVETNKGESYKLKAGEVKKYDLTIQVRCTQEKIIES